MVNAVAVPPSDTVRRKARIDNKFIFIFEVLVAFVGRLIVLQFLFAPFNSSFVFPVLFVCWTYSKYVTFQYRSYVDYT